MKRKLILFGLSLFVATIGLSAFNTSRVKAADPAPTDSSAQTDNSGSCDNQDSHWSWAICPLISLLDDAVNKLDQAINSQLQTPDPDQITNGQGNGNVNQLKETWGRLRNIALLVLVPVMLVMVIGTAIGVSALDAYTVKRAMPRLIIAAIFISLSWYITSFLIRMTNVVGAGLYGLMTQPFGVSQATLSSLMHPKFGEAAAGYAIVGGFFVAALAGVVSIGIVFSLILTAALGLFIGFVILVLRQVMIFALLLLAPLAILAWIFPNNDKMWKLWWGTFSKLLLMYPLIVALIAAGKIFASIIPLQQAGGSGGGYSFLTNVLIMVAYIMPYFLIPLTFKFAGGAFATLTGMINDRSRGIFDRNKKYRQEKTAKNWNEFKAGDRKWRPQSVNRLGQRVGVGMGGRFGFGRVGEQALARHSEVHGAEAMKDNAKLQALALNSDEGIAIAALSGGTAGGAEAASRDLMAGWLAGNEAYQVAQQNGDQATMQQIEGEQELRRQRGVAAARAVGLNHSTSQAAMTLMMQNKARAVGAGDWQSVQNGIERLHGHNTQAAEDMAGTVQYFGREAGRADLGDTTVQRGIQRAGAAKTVRGHTAAVQAAVGDISGRYHAAVAGGDQMGALNAASEMSALRNALGQDVSEDNKRLVYDGFAALGLNAGAPESVDQQLAADMVDQGAVPLVPPDPAGAQQHFFATTRQAGPPSPAQVADYQRMQTITQTTEQIRNRAGLWERGTTPQQAAEAGQQQQPPPVPPNQSDIRLKTDIKHVKTLANGIKLYEFRYIWSNQVYVGVMAQDMLETHPEAVVLEPYGYYSVNYELLGLRMMTIEEWQAQTAKITTR